MGLDLSRWSEPQRQAIQARGQNVLVSAGAGSGKTSVLVERVVHCLTGDIPVDVNRLLVVTFTEAAAGEMRKRISDRLQRLSEEAMEDGDIAASRHVQRQISLMEQSQISTLHSFCMQVVRRNFLPLGIEPVFDLLSEDEALLIRANLVEQLVEESLGKVDSDSFRQMITRFAGGNPSRITPLVFRLDAFSRSQANPNEWLDTMRWRFEFAYRQTFQALPWTEAFHGWVLRHLSEAKTSFREGMRLATGQAELSGYADNLVELISLTDHVISIVTNPNGMDDAARGLHEAISLKSPRAKEHPERDSVKAYRTAGLDLLKTLHEVLSRGEDGLHEDVIRLAPFVAELVTLVQSFQSAYQAHKKSSGVLDFNDLEHFALAALRDSATGEARRLQEQFEEIFVDEYQDTSPIQDALVQAIAKPAGNVFVVGDVKQSIYRFRMAEPKLFLSKYNTLGVEQAGQVIDLSANYRSRREVVDVVNFFFQQLFSEAFGGITYDVRTQMKAGARYGEPHDEPTLSGPVEVHLVERQRPNEESETTSFVHEDFSDEVSVDEGIAEGVDTDSSGHGDVDSSAMEKEALVIGQRIRELMGLEDGHTRHVVWDPKADTYRPIQYRDQVVLLRSVKSRMNTVLEVFRKLEIPAYGATSTGFYGTLEVQWLLAALAAIDNPRREVDFVALLRSPLCQYSDEELAQIRHVHRGNFYDAFKRVATSKSTPEPWLDLAERTGDAWIVPLVAKTKAIYQRFQTWRTLARRAQTEDVLRRLLEDTGFLHYVAGMAGGHVRQANVQVLLDKARAFDRSSFDGVYGFVTRARESLAHDVDVGEARTLTEREDVVRVMTIHQSKGLEYPVVFVADLGKAFHRDVMERAFPLHRELGFGPQFTDPVSDQRWKTLPSIAIEEADLQEFLSEEARVLYVAMTRARERLILVGSVRNLGRAVERAVEASASEQTTLPIPTMMGAKTYLDWLLPALLRHADGQALRKLHNTGGSSARGLDELFEHDARFDISLWNLPGERPLPAMMQSSAPVRVDKQLLLEGRFEEFGRIVASMAEPLRSGERVTPEGLVVTILDDALTVSTPGKVSATELRRLWVAKQETHMQREGGFRNPVAAEHLLEDPVFVRGESKTGRESGIAFHVVMQSLDFKTDPTFIGVATELRDMVAQGRILESDADAVSIDEIVGFLQSNLGQRLAQAKQMMREQPFFYRIPLLDAMGLQGRSGSHVVAQGVIDCLAEEADGWLIVDYKTDRIGVQDAQAKAAEYAAQLATYMAVAESIIPNQLVQAYIYFVKPQVTVPMGRMNVSDVF